MDTDVHFPGLLKHLELKKDFKKRWGEKEEKQHPQSLQTFCS